MSEVQTSSESESVMSNPKIKCEKCQLSFSRKSNFYRHMRRIHKTSPECESVMSNPEIICEKCQLSFSRKSNFYRHMRRIHQEYDLQINIGKVCGICNKKQRTLSVLHKHIMEKHDVNLQFTEKMFFCEDDFFNWKTETEREDQSNFIQERGSRDTAEEGVTMRCYVCHRSGFPAAVGRKERKSNRKGYSSIKIGSTCPASIFVVSETVDGISCITVKYQSVHVGHELGGRLRISKGDKIRLASALNGGLSISGLLKEIRENYDPSHPYRQITSQDLNNLCRDFKLSRTRLVQQDDFVTVDIVVKKIFNSDLQTSLLVYKPVGETLPQHPAVDKNDFLLGIMNDVQEKLLEIYGNACVMIDYTYCETFYLSIMMVRDETDKSLPVASFFSSKISVDMVQPFFEAIQRRLPHLKTKIIMSDDVNYYYDAWQKVFKDDSQHFLCCRYVLRNLFRSVEVKVKKENRKEIKNYLRAILEKEDISTFEFMVMTFIEQYENEENDFITYFKTYYETRTDKWAYCYRIALGMDPDVKLERWRSQLKLDEKGTISKRLDKTLSLVCSIIAKILISNNIVMDMEKLSSRILLSQKLHVDGLSIADEYDMVQVSEKKCTISEIENGKNFSYEIEKMIECCVCDIRCEACNVCIHSMSCTCVDYCVNFAICKHMHRFCQSFGTISRRVTSQESDDSTSFCDNEPMDSLDMELNPQFIVEDIKARVKTQLQLLEKRIEDVKYMEVIKNVEERVNSVNSYLDSATPSCSSSNKAP